MNEKLLNILKIITIIAIIIGALIFKFIPEYKASQGSSDSYIDIDSYQDIIEFKINTKPNFAIITKDSKITNILFFNQESLCLYNKNIENTTISEGIKKIIQILIENNYLKQSASITLTKYKGNYYNAVKDALISETSDLLLDINILEKNASLAEKGQELDINEQDESMLLRQIEIYSKDIIRRSKNDVSINNNYQTTTPDFTETISKEYADAVYKKIENYTINNNVINQDISSSILPINLIPADKEGKIYPDSTSWYYIKDSKVYAYISITKDNKNYSYCYQASIDESKKGQC